MCHMRAHQSARAHHFSTGDHIDIELMNGFVAWPFDGNRCLAFYYFMKYE